MELIRRLLVGLLGMIDAVVYNLISLVYDLLLDIAGATPFDNEIFGTFADRIYALLGLFMLFKVSFSLIKYIVNPDEFSDKVKGGKKLVMNIIITLVLIVAAPPAFDLMYKVQTTLLNEHVVENLILGSGIGASEEGKQIDAEKQGDRIKVAVFSAFYSPDDQTCALANPEDTTAFKTACSSFLGENVATAYSEAYIAGSVNDMIHKEVDGEPLFMQKKQSGDGYMFNYMFIVSTVVGCITALIFLGFCIDIAIRAVKLGFLQLISPIPIISYIDPNSSKSGMFSKWIKEVGKTFIDLFIRLAAVYFAITLIAALMQNPDLGTDNLVARVFIILGILIFTKQIPKLLGDLMGVKIDGNFSLNPMNKITASPLAAGAVGGVLGLAGGAAANLHAGIRDIQAKGGLTGGEALASKAGLKNVGKSIFGTAGSVIAGGTSAMVRSGRASATGKTSPFAGATTGITAASRLRNARDGGYNMRDRVYDSWTDMAGIRKQTGTTSEIEDKMKANSMQIANFKRDEQSYSQQLADLARANPSAYNKAFESSVVRDANGDVVRDATTGRVQTTRTYQDYDSYFSSLSGIDMDAAIASYTSQGISEEEARKRIYNNNYQQHGLLSQQEYAAYESVMQNRDKADDDARKLEKRNKELQGYLDARSGKPKK